MVDFCPECSNLLRKKRENGNVFLACNCGYKQDLEDNNEELKKKIKEKKQTLEENLIVVSEEDKISIHPKVISICPKCSNSEAEAWQEQTRSADEPSTSFFKCVKCKFTWREY